MFDEIKLFGYEFCLLNIIITFVVMIYKKNWSGTNMNYRKYFAIIALAVFTSMIITSCKTHERCPAYGKIISPEKTVKV